MLKRFIGDRSGNFTMMFALAVVPITFALGGAADYGFAVQTRSRMNAAADAAALAAVTPAAMAKDTDFARLVAKQMFNTQVAGLPRLIYDPNTTVPQISDGVENGQRVRKVTINYNAKSQTAFSKILHMDTIAISGSSSSSAKTAPNIDFYLMLDTSPSMEIAATTDGIDKMVNNTKDKCAFACHETNPKGDGLDQDYYTLAGQLGVQLRIDMVKKAVSELAQTAKDSMKVTGAAVRLAGYTFDVAVGNVFNLSDSMDTVKSKADSKDTIQPLLVYQNSWLTEKNNNNDQDTNFDLAFNTLNQTMPAPGNGSNATGDKPQEVLMIVTDALADMAWNGKRSFNPMGPDPSWCQTIKNRGIRIAVLYTTYNPLPTNQFYKDNIASLQPQIEPTAKQCASPNLFQRVDTDGDISKAMKDLFQAAVATAVLTN